MGNISKDKNYLVITLDDNKQSKFNFANGEIIGFSGKVIKTFNPRVKDALAQDKSNILSYVAYQYSLSYYNRRMSYRDIERYIGLAESIGTIYPHISETLLGEIICRARYYLTDKKALFKALSRCNVKEDSINDFRTLYYAAISHVDSISPYVTELIDYVNENDKDTVTTLLKDNQKIHFAIEHEYLEDFYGDMKEHWGGERKLPYQLKTDICSYIRYCNELNEKPIWKDFLKNYAILKRKYKIFKRNKNVEEVKKYQLSANMEFEALGLKVIVPTLYEEFKAEADYQQNCVCAYYFPQVQGKHTHIVFIREEINIDTPYITCEIDNRGSIIQYRTRFNEEVTYERDREFKELYQEYLSKNFVK